MSDMSTIDTTASTNIARSMNIFDQVTLRGLEALCTQQNPPAAQSACPLHVDCRGLCAAIAQGDFDAVVITDGTFAHTRDPVTFMTDTEGVFSGGDAGTEPSAAVSMSDGKRIAVSVDRYLKKVSLTAGREGGGV